jgi:hypothetical protein
VLSEKPAAPTMHEAQQLLAAYRSLPQASLMSGRMACRCRNGQLDYMRTCSTSLYIIAVCMHVLLLDASTSSAGAVL